MFNISFANLLGCTGNFILYFELHSFTIVDTRLISVYKLTSGGLMALGFELNILDQVHICCGGRSPELNDKSRWARVMLYKVASCSLNLAENVLLADRTTVFLSESFCLLHFCCVCFCYISRQFKCNPKYVSEFDCGVFMLFHCN